MSTTPHKKDHFFDTDHLNSQIGARSVRGGATVLIGQAVRFVIQMGSTVVLTRMLSPADFGLIAMVSSITGFIASFADMGLTMAIVQRKSVSHALASNVFWINIAVSMLLTLLCIGLGPILAWFYQEPSALWITVVMSFGLAFAGMSAQHIAILRRQMKFRALMMAEIFGLAVGAITSLIMAFQGAGYWSLVGGTVSAAIGKGCYAAFSTGWIPGMPNREAPVGSALRFGFNVSGFNILTHIARNSDNVLIGKFIGPAATGIYTKAYGLLMLPLTQINTPINTVAVPALSRLRDDPERYRTYYFKAVRVIAYITGPMIALLIATSHDLVPFVLGPQWTEAADIFAILGIASLFQPILYTAGWIWLSMARTKELFWWAAFSTVIYVASFVIGLKWGVAGVSTAYAISVNLLTPIGLKWAYRGTNLDLYSLLKCIIAPYTMSALLFLTVYFTNSYYHFDSYILNLLCSAAVALLTAAIGFFVIPTLRGDVEIIFGQIKKAFLAKTAKS